MVRRAGLLEEKGRFRPVRASHSLKDVIGGQLTPKRHRLCPSPDQQSVLYIPVTSDHFEEATKALRIHKHIEDVLARGSIYISADRIPHFASGPQVWQVPADPPATGSPATGPAGRLT